MSRTERTLPWIIVVAYTALLVMGVAWDASFEATPANSDLVSQGDDRIRELKVEVGDRGEDELCWGTGFATGCPGTGDNGFAREGSARGFFATAAPTTLNDAASTALATGHDGRFWVDNDGVDNVDANNDDNRVSFWNGTAFETFRWEALGGITLTGIASGDILKYNGTVLVNQPTATLTTFDRASFAQNETFTNGTCAVDCTVTDVPDHSSGSDSVGNYAEVTVPSAPSGVVWDIYVFGQVTVYGTSNGVAICEIQQDINDAEAWGGLGAVSSVEVANAQERSCQWHDVVRGVTAGSRYSYRLRMTDPNLTADWDVESVSQYGNLDNNGEIFVEVRPRSIF